MKKTIILTMVAALAMTPVQSFAKKNKTKYFKRKVVVEQTVTPVQEQPKDVAITDVASQLNGEWTMVSLHGKPVVTRDRAYIFLDFQNHEFYGNNGCNFINGKFSASDNARPQHHACLQQHHFHEDAVALQHGLSDFAQQQRQ